MLTVVERLPSAVEKPPQLVRRSEARMPWVWDGLCFAMPANEASSEGLRDVVGNVAPSLITNTGYVIDQRRNPAINLDLASAQVKYPDRQAHDRPSGAITVYARVLFKNSVNSDAFGWIAANYYATTAPFVTWLLGNDSTAGFLRFVLSINGGENTTQSSVASIPANVWVNIFGRWRSGENLRLTVLYDGGALQQAEKLSIDPWSGTLSYAAGQGVWLGCDDSGLTFGGHVSQAMAWSRKLTDAEIFSIAADPFGWYSPRRESVLLAGPFLILPPPATVATVEGTSPYSVAAVQPVISSGVPTTYHVIASPNADAHLTLTVAGTTATTTVPAGTEQDVPTGAATAADVTFVGFDSEDTGV